MARRAELAALLTVLLVSCGPGEKEKTLLQWADPKTGTTYRVTTRPTMVKTNSTLTVESPTSKSSKVIDDEATWGTIAFAKYKNWLLVLNDGYVLAGVDTANGTLVGKGEWGKLPFTVRKSGGAIVAIRRAGSSSHLPADFPLIEEK